MQYANFDTNITLDYDRVLEPGTPTNFTLNVQNISNRDLKNVEAIFNVGKVYEFSSGKINGADGDITFSPNDGKIYFKIPEMKKGETTVITTEVIAKKISKSKEEYNCQFQIKSEDMANYEYSTPVNQSVIRGMIDAKDSTVNKLSQIKENETIVISTTITNMGLTNVTSGKFQCDVPNNMDVREIKCSNGSTLSTGDGTGKIDAKLPIIKANESMTVDMTLKAKNMSGIDTIKVILNRKITADNQEDINIDPFEFTVLNTEKTEEEKEQDRIDNLNKEYEEEQKRQEQEDNANNDNNTNNDNDNVNQNPDNSNNNNNNSNNNNNLTPNEPNTPTQPEENNNPSEPVEVQKYSIKGRAWLDTNKNGAREDDEKALASIKVYLLTVGHSMLKSTTTDSNGGYIFNDVENGKYIVAFVYDNKLYTTTIYKKADVGEDRNSDVIESNADDMNAISNTITVENANIENIDIGLQSRDTFDLQITKYLSKAKVTTKKGTKEYNYNNVDLAKIDIHSKQLKGAKVELEYTITLENKGSLEGYAEQVVDYIGTDIEFDENQNKDWYKGNDGYIYMKNINQTTLNPGQKKEYKINLTKTMTNENTGTISNKVEILKALSNSAESEKADNNISVQNTIITVSTGRTLRNVIIIIFIIGVLAGLGYNQKLPIDIHFDKVYKAKNKKISLKKFYK